VKGALQWPSSGKVVAFFGHQKHPKFDTFLQRKGIDIKANQGSVIRSAFDGIVAFADWVKGYGLLLIIDHGLGDVSLYAHASSLLVNVGDRVKGGQPVGAVGDTGLTGDSMLYFEVRAGGKPVDPIKWLSARK
jgi:septal ring factor EnvC (AmiA/AmiB activator)